MDWGTSSERRKGIGDEPVSAIFKMAAERLVGGLADNKKRLWGSPEKHYSRRHQGESEEHTTIPRRPKRSPKITSLSTRLCGAWADGRASGKQEKKAVVIAHRWS